MLAWFHVIPSDAIYSGVIYVPLALFICKGHRWAMVAMMLLWTLEKGSQLFAAGGRSPFAVVIWWLLFVGSFYQAFLVEQARRASRPVARVS